MVKLTVQHSILEPRFTDIGATPRSNLKNRIGVKISDHLKHLRDPYRGGMLNNASKAAVEAEWRLEVSWAETESNESAKAYEAALIHAYFVENARLPNFKSVHGIWMTGNRLFPNERNIQGIDNPLEWTEWKPMDGNTKEEIPPKPGVYRIRAVPLGT